MKRLVFCSGLVVLLAGGGFAVWYFLLQGPTLAQVRMKYGPEYEAKRQQLKKIAGLLPPAGSVKGNTPARGLDPKPVYDIKQQSFNTEIAMEEQLLDPDVELKSPGKFNLLLFEAGLVMNMKILGPKSVASSSQRVESKYLKQYEDSLKLPYLVVVRTVSYDPPRALGAETYAGGFIELEGFLVDLRTDKVKELGSFRVSAQAPDKTNVTFRNDRSRHDSVETWVYSGMWEDAHRKVAAALTEITGGTFEFKR